MSGKLMGALFTKQLTQPQLVVALALADHAQDDGSRIFPAVGYVAWKVEKSPRQVRRIMRELEALGLLIKVADAQQHRPAEYELHIHALDAKAPPKCRDRRRQGGHPDVTPDQHVTPTQGGHSCVPPENARADISEIQGGHSCVPQGGHPDVRLTVSKPSLKPSQPTTAASTGTSETDLARWRAFEAWCEANGQGNLLDDWKRFAAWVEA
jgi:hypothetical protein